MLLVTDWSLLQILGQQSCKKNYQLHTSVYIITEVVVVKYVVLTGQRIKQLYFHI